MRRYVPEEVKTILHNRTPVFIGDVIAGGYPGAVPAPSPNDVFFARKLLANGTWSTSTSDGSGGSGAEVYNVKDFGAIGSGSSVTLSADDAAAYNAAFAVYGAQGANQFIIGDELDRVAIQCALWQSANTGIPVYIPPGTYRIEKPLILQWTATPIAGQPSVPLICRIFGSGRSSILKGYSIASGRGVIELIGESNGNASNIELSHLQFEQDASCDIASYCIRASDAYCGLNLYRVICKGANGLLLGVASSVTYAQICFLATQCQFWSNYGYAWGSDTGATFYSLQNESLGARWDSAKFMNCLFWGQAVPRAFTLNFDTCIFVTPSDRAVPDNVVMYIGTGTFYNCYFEDHRIGIVTLSTNGIGGLTVRDCHFSSANNIGIPNAQAAIQCARDGGGTEHGAVTIENCKFGGTHTYSAIDLYGPISVAVLRCGAPFAAGGHNINTGPSITTAGDVRLVVLSPNEENAYDVYDLNNKIHLKSPEQIGPVHVYEQNDYGAVNVDENLTVNTTSYAQRKIKVGSAELSMVTYSPSHASLPSYCGIGVTTDIPFFLSSNGLPKLWISDEPKYDNYAKLGGLCYAQTTEKVIENTVTITSIYSSGSGSVVLPANFLRVGRKLVFEGGGVVSSTGSPTIDFFVNFDATNICYIAGISIPSLTEAGFYFRFEVTARAVGASGSFIAVGYFSLDGATYHVSMPSPVADASDVSIVLDPAAQWSAADPANILKITSYSIKCE